MPIWQIGSIKEQPSVQIRNWQIKKMQEGSYFVGDEVGAAGRVSTAIQEYDEETKKGRTASGRIYELLGEPGYSSNGEYVWSIYKGVNRLTELEEETQQG